MPNPDISGCSNSVMPLLNCVVFIHFPSFHLQSQLSFLLLWYLVESASMVEERKQDHRESGGPTGGQAVGDRTSVPASGLEGFLMKAGFEEVSEERWALATRGLRLARGGGYSEQRRGAGAKTAPNAFAWMAWKGRERVGTNPGRDRVPSPQEVCTETNE